MKTKKFTMFYLVLATGLFILFSSCSNDELISEDEGLSADFSIESSLNKESHGKVVHHASLGGNDACESFGLSPGCDKSFSFVANMYEDGTVKGQWQDGFGDDLGGVHINIDCMTVEDNKAQVGGYITKGTDAEGNDLAGLYAVTLVVDNGTSSNDPADQMSFTYQGGLDAADGCSRGWLATVELTRGQVKVW